jgi:serine/threonine protein kinase
MDNLVGRTVANRYRVDSLLGQGGMGNVYKVWDSQRRFFLDKIKLLPSGGIIAESE